MTPPESFHEVGLLRAVAELDSLLAALGADELHAEWDTANGRVAVIVPGPRLTVDGVEVPTKGSS